MCKNTRRVYSGVRPKIPQVAPGSPRAADALVFILDCNQIVNILSALINDFSIGICTVRASGMSLDSILGYIPRRSAAR